MECAKEIIKVNIDQTVGVWVKVEYLGKKRKQEFNCKIMDIEGDNTYEVKFLNKSRIGEFYVFPDAEDRDFIEKRQIIETLNDPTFNNQGGD